MKDRLNELRGLQQDLPPDYEETVVDMERDNQNPFFQEFFQQIDQIQSLIRSIRENVLEIKKKQSAILTAPQPDNRIKEEMEQLMGDVQKSLNRVKNMLQNMDKSNKEQDTNQGNVADVRIRKCQHAALSREFVEVMTEYNSIQSEYRDKCKTRIRRQLDIAGRSLEDDELEDMIESGNPAIFTQGIIVETQQAKESLKEIEARHNDIIHLENSIRELHEMFTDMALLVASQGEMIDRIEYNVENAAEYVQRAVVDTKKAVKYQSKARKKKLFCGGLLLLLILIITIAVVVEFA